MKKNKFLIAVNDLKDIETFKSLGFNNFAIPLKDFAIGYQNLFSFGEIKEYNNNYIIINRILNSKELEELKVLLNNNDIKKLIVSDIGVFNVVRKLYPDIELIWNVEHFGTNYQSIDYWIDKGASSAFIANEITLEQIDEILTNVKTPLVVQVFGYPTISYSRRLLLTNYHQFHNLENKNYKIMQDRVSKKEFIFLESKFGSAVFNRIPYDGREILNLKQDDKVKYYFINYNFLRLEEIVDVINNFDKDLNIETQDNFLHQKTIYKIKGGD